MASREASGKAAITAMSTVLRLNRWRSPASMVGKPSCRLLQQQASRPKNVSRVTIWSAPSLRRRRIWEKGLRKQPRHPSDHATTTPMRGCLYARGGYPGENALLIRASLPVRDARTPVANNAETGEGHAENQGALHFMPAHLGLNGLHDRGDPISVHETNQAATCGRWRNLVGQAPVRSSASPC